MTQKHFEETGPGAFAEAEAIERNHAERIAALEAALAAHGWHYGAAAWRLAVMVAHVTKRGGPLRWTRARIAADSFMAKADGSALHPNTIGRLLAELAAAGLIERRVVVAPRRGKIHAEISIRWRAVFDRTTERAPDQTTERAPDQTTERAPDQTTERAPDQTNAALSLLPFNQENQETTTTRKRPEWAVVAAEFLGEGIGRHHVDKLRAGGSTAGEALGLLAEYRQGADRGAWAGSGALAYRIQTGLWPPPKKPTYNDERRRKREAERKADAEAAAIFASIGFQP